MEPAVAVTRMTRENFLQRTALEGRRPAGRSDKPGDMLLSRPYRASDSSHLSWRSAEASAGDVTHHEVAGGHRSHPGPV